MKNKVVLALTLLCVTAGAAFAESGGDGPFGVPQNANSLPPGFLGGSIQSVGEQQTNHYFAVRAARIEKPTPDFDVAAASANTAR